MMRLIDFLVDEVKDGTMVIFEDTKLHNWTIGCTVKDPDDLFVRSLDPDMLYRDVSNWRQCEREWVTIPVIVVELGDTVTLNRVVKEICNL